MIDLEAGTEAVYDLLRAIGEDPEREGLLDTPRRVFKAWAEMTSGMKEDPRQHLKKVFSCSHDDLVLVRDIEFISLCEHHVLPFVGRAHVGYIPNGQVVGLSKIARLVDGYSKRLQIQEQLTQQIADAMDEVLTPLGVIVVMDASHECMGCRGVKKMTAMTITSAVRGVFKENAAARSEALCLMQDRR